MQELQLTSQEELDSALGAQGFLLLKHSGRCGISVQALREVRTFLLDHPEVAGGWIEVRQHPELSDAITERTGIRHASPQALWIRDGRVTWHATHFDITADQLAALIAAGA